MKTEANGLINDSERRSLRLHAVETFDSFPLRPGNMDEIEALTRQADNFASLGTLSRARGEEEAAERHFREALSLSWQAVNRVVQHGLHLPSQLQIPRAGALSALACGQVEEATRLRNLAFDWDPAAKFSTDWMQIADAAAWPDEWLIAAIRLEPPNAAALDVLADRYWKSLFGRCQLLTLNPEKASDLAQQAWCRVLRARATLRPGGHFLGLLTTVATNLWRDSHRSARRAGPMAEGQMASLEATFSTEDGETKALAELLPDLKALREEEQKLLAQEIDQALEKLTPLLRTVLVSRLLAGESCAEIGRRYGRTEQTISAWVRQAVQQMRRHLINSNAVASGENKP